MNCKLVWMFVSVVATWHAAGPAFAQSITVKVHRTLSEPTLCPCSTDPEDPPPHCTETYTYASGSDITIDVAYCIDSINIYGGTNVDVGLITINGSGIGSSSRLEIILGAASWSNYDGDDRQSVAALRDFGGIVFNNSSTRNNSILGGRVAGEWRATLLETLTSGRYRASMSMDRSTLP